MLQQFYLRVQVRLSRKTKIPTISSKLDLYTAVLQVKFPAVRDSRAVGSTGGLVGPWVATRDGLPREPHQSLVTPGPGPAANHS